MNSLVARLFKAKYYPDSDIFAAKLGEVILGRAYGGRERW